MIDREGKVGLTADEIVSTLSHSFLPTVIVEGDDDVIFFRQLEEVQSEYGLSVLAVGGRETALQVFNRRNEIQGTQKIAFIVDRDTWVIVGIPQSYENDDLLFTTGYSIENDLFVDGELLRLMAGDERIKFEAELIKVVEWFALALSRILAGANERIGRHPNELLDNEERRLEMLRLNPGEPYPDELREIIYADYANLLRGKTLIGLLMRQLSYAGRQSRHNQLSMLEMVAHKKGPRLLALFEKVRALFI